MKCVRNSAVGFFIFGCTLIGAVLIGPASARAQTAPPIRGVVLPDSKLANLQQSPACPNKICPGLGNAFYLPATNAYSVNSGGTIFFSNRTLGDCALMSQTKKNSREFKAADSWSQFIANSTAEADIHGKYETDSLSVSASAQAMTGYSIDTKTALHSTALDITVISQSIDFQQSTKCFTEQNLDSQFVKQFESLAPIEAEHVEAAAQWDSYVRFLQSYGSHIMMQQLIGSRFEQWESSSSSASDIAKNMQIKACAEVEGTGTDGGWSVGACGSYSSDEKKRALQTQSQSRRLILGSTDRARGDLTKSINQKNLEAFIDGADEGNGAVRFVFKPIWQLLLNLYQADCAKGGKASVACANVQRAVNLQAAYEGWLAVGCPVAKDGREIAYQRMAIEGTSSLGINTYKCVLSRSGCRTDDDCHIGGLIASQCYCYGPGCIEQDSNSPVAGTFRNKVRATKEGGTSEGVNSACYYKPGVYCDCDKSWSGGLLDRNIYQQSGQ